MFDIGFSEMMVIAVVALIVIGPERLPKVARTLGHLWGRAQRYVNGVKADISRDMALDEFRKMQQKVQQEADASEHALSLVSQELDQQVQQLNTAVAQPEEAIVQDIQSPAKPVPLESKIPEQQKFPID
ncbi:MAG: sec-independent protein translocase protein [Gallionellaceae bacterium]|nr:MAG: sec-independent protein translocase protein [Gallionellaceae bacterium]